MTHTKRRDFIHIIKFILFNPIRVVKHFFQRCANFLASQYGLTAGKPDLALLFAPNFRFAPFSRSAASSKAALSWQALKTGQNVKLVLSCRTRRRPGLRSAWRRCLAKEADRSEVILLPVISISPFWLMEISYRNGGDLYRRKTKKCSGRTDRPWGARILHTLYTDLKMASPGRDKIEA